MSIRGVVTLLLIFLGIFLTAALIASRGADVDEKLAVLAASLAIWVVIVIAFAIAIVVCII